MLEGGCPGGTNIKGKAKKKLKRNRKGSPIFLGFYRVLICLTPIFSFVLKTFFFLFSSFKIFPLFLC